MTLARDYQKPFWRGFFHAILFVLYALFLAIVLLSLDRLFQEEIGIVIQVTCTIFLSMLSFAVLGYLVFFEPMKKIMHHHFRAATIMLGSTLGWLLVFLAIFLVGLVRTLGINT